MEGADGKGERKGRQRRMISPESYLVARAAMSRRTLLWTRQRQLLAGRTSKSAAEGQSCLLCIITSHSHLQLMIGTFYDERTDADLYHIRRASWDTIRETQSSFARP